MDDQDDDQDFVIYGDAEDEPYKSKALPDHRQRRDTGRTYASLHQQLSKKREEESTNPPFLPRGGQDQLLSERQPGDQAAYGGAPFGKNVIANLEARFQETAVGMDAIEEEPTEPLIVGTAATEAKDPLAALGLQAHMIQTQQPSREDSVLLNRAGTSTGYLGAPTSRKRRQLGSSLRSAAEQHAGYGSKRKTPLSKQQHRFAIRETPVTAGERTTSSTAVPDILKTLRSLDARTPGYASSEERILEEDEMAEDVQGGPPGQAARAVTSPETPHLSSNTVVAPHAHGSSMPMQTPAAAVRPGVDSDMHEAVVSPGTAAAKSAQRQFLASVLQGVHLPTWQVQTGRGAAPGSLAARLQQEEALMAHPNGEDTIQVEILEKEQEDNIIKCRCKKLGEDAGDSCLFAFIKSSMSVDTDIGCRMSISSPWKLMQLPTTSIPLIFVFHARNM